VKPGRAKVTSAPNTAAKASASARSTSARGALPQQPAIVVTPPRGSRRGRSAEVRQVGGEIEREAVAGHPARQVHPIAPIFSTPAPTRTHTLGPLWLAVGDDFEARQRADQTLFESRT